MSYIFEQSSVHSYKPSPNTVSVAEDLPTQPDQIVKNEEKVSESLAVHEMPQLVNNSLSNSVHDTSAPGSIQRMIVKKSSDLSKSTPMTATGNYTEIMNSEPKVYPESFSEKPNINTSAISNSPDKKSSKSTLSNNEKQSMVEKVSAGEKQKFNHYDDEVLKASSKSVNDALTPIVTSNIDKIANMSKVLSNEANTLRQSIKSLSADIARTKQELSATKEEDVNFPYHLFIIELIVNKIYMKCECLDIDPNNLIIAAVFLGKQPIVLYDSSYGKIENFAKLNVGKSTLFAMTYDKICSIRDFVITIQLTKQPPCTNCVTKIGETKVDCTNEFKNLREDLCTKWTKGRPNDNIVCTTSGPLSKNLYYLSCSDDDHKDSIGVIEVSVRMSFLGKEITTFCPSPKQQGTTFLLKEDNGMSMYSCHKVEMDDQGKILLDENTLTRKEPPCDRHYYSNARRPRRDESPISSVLSSRRSYEPLPYSYNQGECTRYDEIFTKMNANELKIKVPKSTKVERHGRYERIQELCSCENTPYNTGEQIQFQLPKDLCNADNTHDTYSSNFKYTYKGCDKTCDRKDKKVINVTPTNCNIPVAMEKVLHPQKDVFILKIGKKLETKDKKTDLEIELVTPKGPTEKAAENQSTIAQQCSNVEVKKSTTKTNKKKLKKKKSKEKVKKGKLKKSKK